MFPGGSNRLTTLPSQRKVPVGRMYDGIDSQLRNVSLDNGQFLPQKQCLLREDSDTTASWRWFVGCLALLG